MVDFNSLVLGAMHSMTARGGVYFECGIRIDNPET